MVVAGWSPGQGGASCPESEIGAITAESGAERDAVAEELL